MTAIERVEMNSRCAVRDQIDALRRRVGHPQLHYRLRIVAAAIKLRAQLKGQRSAARDRKALHLRRIRDRHNSRNYWNANAGGSCSFHKVPVVAVVEKELCDQKIEAFIHFPLQVIQIHRRITAFGMFLRVGSAAHAKRSAMPLFDKSSQFAGIAKSPFRRHERRLALRRIAAEGQNVLDAGRCETVQNRAYLLLGGAHAGQVSHGFDARLPFDPRDDVYGFFARGTASTPGDGDECGLERPEIRNSPFELKDALIRLRREELKRDRRCSGGKKIPDEHDSDCSDAESERIGLDLHTSHMIRTLRFLFRLAVAIALVWAIALVCYQLDASRSTASLMMLLGVLGISSFGDWIPAMISCGMGSLAFSYYFVDDVGSFRITTVDGAVTFVALLLTALTASRLSIRAQHRASEAIRRREEMERLHQFASVLLSARSVSEAADNAVRKLVALFDLRGAALRIEGEPKAFLAGVTEGVAVSVVPLNAASREDVLELYGPQPSGEVRNTLASMLSLVIERARSSEERARFEATRRGEELRSTVLNALAHNFRTPLTSIKAAASALRGSENIPLPEERELIEVIDEEADRLDQLIGESLNLARIEGRRANPRTEECLFPEIVGSVARRLERYLGRRELSIDVPEDLPAIIGDKFLLEQMLMQVVDNAWKYSVPGARISISARQSGADILLSVQNEGSEIPESEQTLIFDKFYRGSKDRWRVEGTGLGLAIARTIAEAYKGKVWLDAEPQGPAFRFALPLEATGKKSDNEPHYLADRR
jgi:two-component system sensor histidine kinase KdpD